jgi:hypothetical protein
MGYEVCDGKTIGKIIPPLKGVERKKIARWAILAKEPDCRVGFVVCVGGCFWGEGWVK